jgi:hypothetical protein
MTLMNTMIVVAVVAGVVGETVLVLQAVVVAAFVGIRKGLVCLRNGNKVVLGVGVVAILIGVT